MKNSAQQFYALFSLYLLTTTDSFCPPKENPNHSSSFILEHIAHNAIRNCMQIISRMEKKLSGQWESMCHDPVLTRGDDRTYSRQFMIGMLNLDAVNAKGYIKCTAKNDWEEATEIDRFKQNLFKSEKHALSLDENLKNLESLGYERGLLTFFFIKCWQQPIDRIKEINDFLIQQLIELTDAPEELFLEIKDPKSQSLEIFFLAIKSILIDQLKVEISFFVGQPTDPSEVSYENLPDLKIEIKQPESRSTSSSSSTIWPKERFSRTSTSHNRASFVSSQSCPSTHKISNASLPSLKLPPPFCQNHSFPSLSGIDIKADKPAKTKTSRGQKKPSTFLQK